jgi:hypothetical protein
MGTICHAHYCAGPIARVRHEALIARERQRGFEILDRRDLR